MKLRKLAAMTICSSLCAFSVSAGALGDTFRTPILKQTYSDSKKWLWLKLEHSYKIPVLRAASRSPRDILENLCLWG